MTISNEIQANRDKMATVLKEFQTKVEQIRKDPMKSALAKKTEITQAFNEVKERAAKYRDNEKIIVAKAIDEKERHLFGYETQTDIISRRDADDRANSITHEQDALNAYRRAMQTSDTTLQRALALKAHESGWRDLLAHHFEQRPTESNLLNELVSLRSFRDDSGKQILAGTHYMVMPPADL